MARALSQQIMEVFLRDQSQEFHAAKIARVSGCSPASASSHLKSLCRQGVLSARWHLGSTLYKARPECPLFREHKIYFNIQQVKKSGLITHLARVCPHSEAIVLCGDYGSGEDDKSTPVEVDILTQKLRKLKLCRFELALGRAIKVKQIQRRKKYQPREYDLLNRIVNGHVVRGYLGLFQFGGSTLRGVLLKH